MSSFGHRSALRHRSGCVLPGCRRVRAGDAGIAPGYVTSVFIHTEYCFYTGQGMKMRDEGRGADGKKKVTDFICDTVNMEGNSYTQPKEAQTLWENRGGLCNANIKAYIAH